MSECRNTSDPGDYNRRIQRRAVTGAAGLIMVLGTVVGISRVEHARTHTDTVVSHSEGDMLRQLAVEAVSQAMRDATQGIDSGRLRYKPDMTDSYMPSGFDIVSRYREDDKVIDIRRPDSHPKGLTEVVLNDGVSLSSYEFSNVRNAIVPSTVVETLPTWVLKKAEVNTNDGVEASIELKRTDGGYVVTTVDDLGVPDDARDAVAYATRVIYGELPSNP